jgi:hypothetical protein
MDNRTSELITRDLPESFWDCAVWRDYPHEGDWVSGNVDVADRKRMVEGIIAKFHEMDKPYYDDGRGTWVRRI